MAAVIAQMAKAKRERSERKKINIDKCVYELKPFDSHFDAKKHNKYMVAKAANLENEEAEKFYNFVVERLKQLRQEEIASRRFSWGYEF